MMWGDVGSSWVYWSDWGARAHIGRAGMDGSRARVIVSERLGWPNALTVAPRAGELYFADAREDYVAVAALDGSGVRVLFSRGTGSTLTYRSLIISIIFLL